MFRFGGVQPQPKLGQVCVFKVNYEPKESVEVMEQNNFWKCMAEEGGVALNNSGIRQTSGIGRPSGVAQI